MPDRRGGTSGSSAIVPLLAPIGPCTSQAAPGTSRLAKDEGLAKTGQAIEPPPPMGLSPTTQATQNVIPVSGPGLPQPSVRFGSTVCQ